MHARRKNKGVFQYNNTSTTFPTIFSSLSGWPPHVHFQLSLVEPVTHDMPGAVLQSDREHALRTYPDPQLVTGRFY